MLHDRLDVVKNHSDALDMSSLKDASPLSQLYEGAGDE